MAHTAGCYWWNAKRGTFRIQFNGRDWGVWFNGDCLGEYGGNLIGAFEDLVGGHTTWPAEGDPSAMGLPSDLEDWNYSPPRS